MDDLTNRRIEVTLEEMERNMGELKRRMREINKTEKKDEGVRGQGVK